MVADLVRAIEHNAKPCCNEEDGRWTIEMIHSVYQAQKTGESREFSPSIAQSSARTVRRLAVQARSTRSVVCRIADIIQQFEREIMNVSAGRLTCIRFAPIAVRAGRRIHPDPRNCRRHFGSRHPRRHGNCDAHRHRPAAAGHDRRIRQLRHHEHQSRRVHGARGKGRLQVGSSQRSHSCS